MKAAKETIKQTYLIINKKNAVHKVCFISLDVSSYLTRAAGVSVTVMSIAKYAH